MHIGSAYGYLIDRLRLCTSSRKLGDGQGLNYKRLTRFTVREQSKPLLERGLRLDLG
jgi:hypothetical protein